MERPFQGFVVALFVFMTLGAGMVCAAQVRAVDEHGVLQLDNGQKIELAGIQISPESIPLLKVLLENQNVELHYENGTKEGSADTAAPGAPSSTPLPAYVYVTTREMELPFPADAAPQQKTVLVNQMLIRLGAARVGRNVAERWRHDFMQAQDSARKAGEGVWSYTSMEHSTVGV